MMLSTSHFKDYIIFSTKVIQIGRKLNQIQISTSGSSIYRQGKLILKNS